MPSLQPALPVCSHTRKAGTSEYGKIDTEHSAGNMDGRALMSTFEKRAREDKRNQKARGKAQRRAEKRNAPPSTGSEFTTVAEIVGNMRSVEEVMRSLQTDAQAPR